IFCFLPPHVLREIAKRGNAAERNAALDTLALDSTLRSQRAVAQLLPAMPHLSAMGAPPQTHRSISTANNNETLPGTMVRAEGQAAVSDVSVNEAYDGLGNTFDFYLEAYQRNSIDDHGLPLVATVHYGDKYNNAFWNGEQMVFGDGDGVIFNRFTACL